MEAKLNITYSGSNGDLIDMISYDLSDSEIRRIATEAVASGSVPGIAATNPDFSDFVIERFGATDVRPFPLISVRPKTPFG
jgi:hypothetical protein